MKRRTVMTEFCLQQDSNSGPYDPKSGHLDTSHTENNTGFWYFNQMVSKGDNLIGIMSYFL